MNKQLPEKAFQKVYLGDGAYASFDGDMIWLTTEDGIRTTNRVALEPEVLRAFEAYVFDLRSIIQFAGGKL